MEDFIKNFADALEIENPDTLSGETNFKELPEWGSMAILSLIAMADTEYKIELDANLIAKATKIKDLYNAVK